MILTYHDIVPDHSDPERCLHANAITVGAFSRHLSWLRRRYQFVSIAEYLAANPPGKTGKTRCVSLTFDDGGGATFEHLFPLLQKQQIPATIFVATAHLETTELLWFNYLRALYCEHPYELVSVGKHRIPFRNRRQRDSARALINQCARASGDPVLFSRELQKRYPVSDAVIGNYRGMTFEQLRLAAACPLIEIGAHTVNHPFLSDLPVTGQRVEIQESRRILRELTGRPVPYFAYPSTDYSRETINLVKNAGYVAAFALAPRRISHEPRFEIRRTGVYSSSLLALRAKAFLAAHAG
ncbi:MAG: polysaccharide deacetylase family protein [Verrucomicrobiota bacterium]